MALDKQKLFCREYVKDYNGTQAAIRAGYSPKTASVQASRLLKKSDILELIRKNQQEVLNSTCLSEEKLINKLQDILDRCMTATPVKEWDYSEHEYIEKGEYQFDSKGALKAIELLGKHLGVFERSKSNERSNDGFVDALNKKAGEINWEE